MIFWGGYNSKHSAVGDLNVTMNTPLAYDTNQQNDGTELEAKSCILERGESE